MTKQRFNFLLDDSLRQGLHAVRERDGIIESEQIRRAIREWLERKGIVVKEAAPRRVSPRRKA